MLLSHVICERRSIRKFNSSTVDHSLIYTLLEKSVHLYGSAEPCPCRFVFAGSEESREKLWAYVMPKLMDSGVTNLLPRKIVNNVIDRFPGTLIVFVRRDGMTLQNDKNYAQACRVMQIFQLLAWQQGLGVVWNTTQRLLQDKSILKKLGIREHENCVGLLHMGYFDTVPKAKKRTVAENRLTVGKRDEERDTSTLRDEAVSHSLILELLNVAVWAPTHQLREPWRFIWVGSTDEPQSDLATPSLLVVQLLNSNEHKQMEDLAAVWGLVQNFVFAAEERFLQVRLPTPEWIYNKEQCRRWGVGSHERIVAVLQVKRSKIQTRHVSPKVALALEIL